MREKLTKVVKWITYFLPFIWLFARNYFPIMQFETLEKQGAFLLFVMFGLCVTILTFPKFEKVNMILGVRADDEKNIRNMKILFFAFDIVYVSWMIFSVIEFNMFTFWEESAAQIIFLVSLTWYLWYSFGMALLKYCDVKELEESK